MGTIAASTLIGDCLQDLQDTASDRYARTDMLRYLNEGQRVIVVVKPEAYVVHQTLTLVAGPFQELPATAVQLAEILCNVAVDGALGRVITLARRDSLDRQAPMWMASTPEATVRQYLFDPQDPRRFMVDPPATAGIRVRAKLTPTPAAVPSEADPIVLDDIWESALRDWMMFRALSRDITDQVSMGMAQTRLTSVANQLGLKTSTELERNPNLKPFLLDPQVVGAAR